MTCEATLATHPVTQVLQRRARAGSRPGARDDGHRVALVLEGGGMRGVVSAGMTAALERLRADPCFDWSRARPPARSTARRCWPAPPRRAVATYSGPLASRAFINPLRLLRGKPVIDVNDILKLATGLESAGHDRITSGEVGCTPSRSTSSRRGRSTLSGMRTETEVWDALLASSRMPWAGGPPVELGGRRYLDGGMGSAVPVAEALAAGATHVLVLQTRPYGIPRKSSSRLGDR